MVKSGYMERTKMMMKSAKQIKAELTESGANPQTDAAKTDYLREVDRRQATIKRWNAENRDPGFDPLFSDAPKVLVREVCTCGEPTAIVWQTPDANDCTMIALCVRCAKQLARGILREAEAFPNKPPPPSDEEIAEELDIRVEAGKKIDRITAETARLTRLAGCDPYQLDWSNPPSGACVGRDWFARFPGGVWVAFDDLPEATRTALEKTR
jgi:hypothetical protein